MFNFSISVKKLTDVELMREACECTFIGSSKQSLLGMYKAEHSPARTQMFWISAKHIPLFVSTHLIRHHVGSIPFQLTCRDDRSGGNPGLIGRLQSVIDSLHGDVHEGIIGNAINELEWLQDNADRYTPVNLSLLVNAQALIDIAKLRLCNMAHKETIEVFEEIKRKVAEVDPDLASMMVRKCVYRGGICGESRCCGFNHTLKFRDELKNYIKNFSESQVGCYLND